MSTDYLDQEAKEQLRKYDLLLRTIRETRSRGEDFLLRTAAQISLYRWKDERHRKRVYESKEPYPYIKHPGNVYQLSVATAERWEQYLEYCGLRRIDPLRHLDTYGFGPPAPKGKERQEQAETGEPSTSDPTEQ